MFDLSDSPPTWELNSDKFVTLLAILHSAFPCFVTHYLLKLIYIILIYMSLQHI